VSDLERRAVTELRARDAHIVGHAVIFDVRSVDLGGFIEIVRPAAVDRALLPDADIRALYAHDPSAVLGRTPKTLQVAKDTRGLTFDLDPAPTTAGKDALTLVQRGDVTGASFGFRTLKDWWHVEGDTVIRELLDLEIVEISLTAFPAYQQTDVSVAQRALRNLPRSPMGGSRSIAWLRRELRIR
jgi:HK97 family phage prohead protease